MNLLEVAREHLGEIVPLTDTPVRAALQDAAVNAANFTRRKLAKQLLELTPAEHLPIALLTLELAQADLLRAGRLKSFFVYAFEKVEDPAERQQMIRATFDKGVAPYYDVLLSGHLAQPSAETWSLIWPRVLAEKGLSLSLIKRFGLFQKSPPVTVTEAFLAREWTVARALARRDDAGMAAFWSCLYANLDHLLREEGETLFSILSGPALDGLLEAPGFATELAATLTKTDLRKLPAYSSLWDELAGRTEMRLGAWARTPDYAVLIDKAFTTMLENAKEPFAYRLAVFLAKAPYDMPTLGKYRAGVQGALAVTGDQEFANRLRKILAREPQIDPAAPMVDMRSQMHAANLAIVQVQMQAAEMLFKQKMADIVSGPLPPAERAREIQRVSAEYQAQIAQLTATLKSA